MALEVGTVKDRTGLAGKLADEIEAVVGGDFDEDVAADNLEAIAKAIIEYFLANAEFTGTDSAGDTPDNIALL
jgi:hypothetical protein